jgi:hypothetical protein
MSFFLYVRPSISPHKKNSANIERIRRSVEKIQVWLKYVYDKQGTLYENLYKSMIPRWVVLIMRNILEKSKRSFYDQKSFSENRAIR